MLALHPYRDEVVQRLNYEGNEDLRAYVDRLHRLAREPKQLAVIQQLADAGDRDAQRFFRSLRPLVHEGEGRRRASIDRSLGVREWQSGRLREMV